MSSQVLRLSYSQCRISRIWRKMQPQYGTFRQKSLHSLATFQRSAKSLSGQVSFKLFPTWARCMARLSANLRRTGMVTPVFLSAEQFVGRTAIVDQFGHFTYEDLLHYSFRLSKTLNQLCGEQVEKLDHARIGFLCENDASYVVTQWAIWMSNGIAVPLGKSYPTPELEYFVEDSGCSLLVASEHYAHKLSPIATCFGLPLHIIGSSELNGQYTLNEWYVSEKATASKKVGKARKTRPKRWFDHHAFRNGFKNDPAMIIYTSGTTGRPKGVVLTHGNLMASVESMITAWGWSSGDVLLHVLPLHHMHGIVNALMTPLTVGATCLMLPKFDAHKVWSCLVNSLSLTNGVRVNVFMAVPTIYSMLIQHYETHLHRGRGSRLTCEYIRSVCMSRIRLMVSGSAALPQPVFEKWESITGHRLLERYGMTEIGMALTNPLSGPRIPGTVGQPFPSVKVRVAKMNVYAKNGYDILADGNSQRTLIEPGHENESGELLVKGPSVFHEYWKKPKATQDSFTPDGWFKTGDTVAVHRGVYRILGRTSVDIIKSGAHKVSALEVERHLLSHPLIKDCAVVGLPDITWGQRVAGVVVLEDGQELSLENLKVWAHDILPNYEIPSVLRCVPSLPRNSLGKVNKKHLIESIFPEFLRNL